jgi:hypothetical protein
MIREYLMKSEKSQPIAFLDQCWRETRAHAILHVILSTLSRFVWNRRRNRKTLETLERTSTCHILVIVSALLPPPPPPTHILENIITTSAKFWGPPLRRTRARSSSCPDITNIIYWSISVRTEQVKLPLCNSYSTTSFTRPNIFNHTSQDEAIFHLHTFSPLIATFCHRELVLFTCMVHIPWYDHIPDAPARIRPVCRSLCDRVYTGCKSAMDKLNFHWPEKISCDKFADITCSEFL